MSVKFTKNIDDYLVIEITGVIATYIAEVTQSKPLQMKVTETGPYAHLKSDDFIIHEEETSQFQRDIRENTDIFLRNAEETGKKIGSGLKSLGITDDEIHEILPQGEKK